MKSVIIFFLFTSLSAANANFCSDKATYMNSDWVIHNPSSFDTHLKHVQERISHGVNEGSVIFDTSGPVVANHTMSGKSLILNAQMYDDLQTPQHEMYGDLATLETLESPKQFVEVRWYEQGQRHIVFNPDFLTCVTSPAPMVVNSVL